MRRLLCLMSLVALLTGSVGAVEGEEVTDPVETVEVAVEPPAAQEEGGGEEDAGELDGYLSDAGGILPLADIQDGYGVGTSNTAIFGGVVSKLPYGVHYVYYREGQYRYCLAYADSLELSGSEFTAPSATVVSYTTGSSYQGQATWNVSTESNFTLDAENYLVWSDLGDYPELTERREGDYAQLACVMLASFGLYYLFRSLWRSICR